MRGERKRFPVTNNSSRLVLRSSDLWSVKTDPTSKYDESNNCLFLKRSCLHIHYVFIDFLAMNEITIVMHLIKVW